MSLRTSHQELRVKARSQQNLVVEVPGGTEVVEWEWIPFLDIIGLVQCVQVHVLLVEIVVDVYVIRRMALLLRAFHGLSLLRLSLTLLLCARVEDLNRLKGCLTI